MNDFINQDTVKLVSNIDVKYLNKVAEINIWMCIALLEFAIIVFLLIYPQKEKSAKSKFKDKALKSEIDFNNIINSSFNSIQLYNELKVKCHPDRFPLDLEKNAVAEELFQEISINKNNIKRLLELKETAILKLNINI